MRKTVKLILSQANSNYTSQEPSNVLLNIMYLSEILSQHSLFSLGKPPCSQVLFYHFSHKGIYSNARLLLFLRNAHLLLENFQRLYLPLGKPYCRYRLQIVPIRDVHSFCWRYFHSWNSKSPHGQKMFFLNLKRDINFTVWKETEMSTQTSVPTKNKVYNNNTFIYRSKRSYLL